MVVAVLAAAAGASLSLSLPPDHRHHSLLLLNHRLHHQLDHTPSLRRESRLQSGSRVFLHPRSLGSNVPPATENPPGNFDNREIERAQGRALSNPLSPFTCPSQ